MNLTSVIIERLIPKNYNELCLGLSMELHIEALENEPEFCEEFIKPSMENLALSFNGNQPEKSFRFSEKKLVEWCEKNDISVRRSYDKNCFILTILNTNFWKEKLTNRQKELYQNAVDTAIHFFDMKNKCHYPTNPNQIKRISHATEPFVEYIYIADVCILVWDHQNGRKLETTT